MRTLNAVDSARFRALEFNSAGQLAAPAPSTLVPSTLVVRTLSLCQSGHMDHCDKENAAIKTERCDTPATFELEDIHQTHSPVKSATQPESGQSSSVKNFPLSLAAAPSSSPAKGIKQITSAILTSTPVKKQSSRPSSPVKTPGSRPPSRPSNPLKRTPAPGKNEHLETTPTGFRYTIELPESKIVPKKSSAATPSKSKTSTPVKKFVFVDVPSKQNIPKRANSLAKSASPRKARAASPEKKGGVNGVNGAEPTPTNAAPWGRKKRNSVKLTKTNDVHAGTPTVEVTKEDAWTGVQLKSTLTSEGGGFETQVNEKGSLGGERGTDVDSPSPSPASMEGQEESVGLPRTQSIPTNFGEMLRNSSQTVLRSSFYNEAPQKISASPTVLDMARQSSEMRAQSLVGVIAKPNFKADSLATDAIALVTKDFANGALDGVNKDSLEKSPIEPHKNSTRRRVSFVSISRTPTGTPPAIMAAIEVDMGNIRSILQRSLGDGYASALVSPNITRWPGSSRNGRSPPDLPLASDGTNIGNSPRRNLNERMAAAKQGALTKPSPHSKKATPAPLTLRPKDKAGAQPPLRSRLPRPSPMKAKKPLRTLGTIPKARRTSPFDVRMSPSRVPAMASHRARYTRASEKKGETVGFASAEDIAKQVEEWNRVPTEKEPVLRGSPNVVAKTPVKTTRDHSKDGLGFMRPTAISAKKEKQTPNEEEQETYTPPGSPSLPQPPYHTLLSPPKPKEGSLKPARKPISPLKNRKVRALTSTTPRTPLPRGKGSLKALDRGASRTPSKEMVSKLDKEIDAHLENEAQSGRVYTPSGQRISDLLAKRRESERA